MDAIRVRRFSSRRDPDSGRTSISGSRTCNDRRLANSSRAGISNMSFFSLVMAATLVACGGSAWEKARGADTVDSYRRFLAEEPEDEHAGTAERRIETLAFRDADRSRSLRAYRRYLADYPDGAFAERAKAGLVEARRRDALEDGSPAALERFWRRHPHAPAVRVIEEQILERRVADLRRSPTIEKARAILDDFPRGPHVAEAQALAEGLSLDGALRSDVAAIERYLQAFPAGARRPEALARLESARADEALASGNETSLRVFLRDHPSSSRVPEIADRLAVALTDRAELTLNAEVAEAAVATAPAAGKAVGRARAVLASLRRGGRRLGRAREAVEILSSPFPLRRVTDLREALSAGDPIDVWEAVREAALSDEPEALDVLLEAIGSQNALTSYYAAVALPAFVSRLRLAPIMASRARLLEARTANPEDRLRLAVIRDAQGDAGEASMGYETSSTASRVALAASVLALLRAADRDDRERIDRLLPPLLALVRERVAATEPPGRESADARAAALPGSARTLFALSTLTGQLAARDALRARVGSLAEELAARLARIEAEARERDARFRTALEDPIARRAAEHSARRIAAAVLLGALREPLARPALERARRDPDPAVHAAALRALSRLGPARRARP
ncbi:MAG: hypothetical protein HYY06_00890 [Deltaproteobacteria bacterium]|nr:hypothetical protein [Deltaproteobacteria bacterium]